MKIISASIVLAFCSSALAAQGWTCLMTSECLDTEACVETAYEIDIDALEGQYLLSDIAGERAMSEVAPLEGADQRSFVSKIQDTSVGLFSLYPDGRAQYTQHSPDYSVRYSGTCEGSS
ncbi:MAG: hypothetical protein WBC85_11375 [Planktotalea sp.]|uniref:hypothetical protein n=1 Tax=Planktotalea sp. TaxID=2029877 RepID=UPI003C782D84